MKTVVRIIAVTAMIGVVLSSGAVAEPVANGPELCFELVDGTVITGRTDVKAITIRIASGNVLKIPVAELTELTVGLNDRPGFVKRVDSLVHALDSDKTRQAAMQELTALGPAVAPIVKRLPAGDVSERLAAVTNILAAYKGWSTAHPDAPEVMARPLEQQSKVKTGKSILIGTVAVRGFRIASPYGPVTVKLDEVHRIRPVAQTTPDQFGRWSVELRDETHLGGMVISQSLRVQTRRGTMVVPFARIHKAIIADDGKTIRVQCWGSDRIVGVLEPKTTISLKTDEGRVDLSAGKIAVVAYGLLTLKGHSGEVTSVAFSSDGKRLASASSDHTVRLWDTLTGKELLSLRGASNEVAFSPDGDRLASGGDKIIKLWDTVIGKELLTIKGHSGGVYSVAFSPDGKRLASGSGDKTIKLWDTTTGKGLLAIKGHTSCISSVAFSPDGKRLVSGDGGTIRLWDTAAGKELLTIKGHQGWVYSVAFSPDGKRLASGGVERAVILWDAITGKELLTLKGRSNCVFTVAFSPDGKRLASGHEDKTIKIWDTVTGKELFALKGHLRMVFSIAFSPDGKRLASGSQDKTVKLWEIPDWTK